MNIFPSKLFALDQTLAAKLCIAEICQQTISADMDLTHKLLGDCSPYIFELIYDLDRREVRLVCVNNPDDYTPAKCLKFTGVLAFKEEVFELDIDDTLMDSVIGINLTSDGTYCIHTEKREITIDVDADPTIEKVD